MARKTRPSKSAGQHADALAGIWLWAFEPSPAAALRRRIALWLLMAAFLGLLLTLRTQGMPIWLALFSPASLGHLLLAVFVFWLALSSAAAVLQALFPIVSTGDARNHILRIAFGGRYETLHTHGAQDQWEDERGALAQSGGPGWLKVHLENAAITERSDGSARVLGPSRRPALLNGFERLRAVLHLKEQVLTLNVWARSRDGIRVRVEGARLMYSLVRGKREPSLQQPYPFDEKAALSLVYGQRVEQSSRRVARLAGSSNLVAEQGQAFFERELQEFVGQFTLGELLAKESLLSAVARARPEQAAFGGDEGRPEADEATPASLDPFASVRDTAEGFSGKLFLARDKLREAFIARSQEPAAALGLQINWVDIGTWKLDERVRAALSGHEQGPEDGSQSTRQERESELAALIDRLLPDNLEQIGEAWIAEALSNFAQLFGDLRDQYEELKNESEPQLESVIRFLNLLTKQRVPRKT